MGKLIKRAWKYLTALLTGKLNEVADPKIQLEQAIAEAQDQHRRLKEQAASVIANQKQTEMKLSRALEELEKTGGSAKQALMMGAEADGKSDTVKAAEYNRAAESFASRLIAIEHEVEDLKSLHYQASQASDQAKQAVQQNATVLQRRLSERQKLMGQLDQAKMAEQMNTAMSSLQESVGQDVPTFDEVRTKIEARYAKAKGMQELQEDSVEGRMLEVEHAQMDTEAQARLSELRAQLGIGAGAAEAETVTPSAAPERAPERVREEGGA